MEGARLASLYTPSLFLLLRTCPRLNRLRRHPSIASLRAALWVMHVRPVRNVIMWLRAYDETEGAAELAELEGMGVCAQPEGVQLIGALLALRQADRISATDALAHGWLKIGLDGAADTNTFASTDAAASNIRIKGVGSAFSSRLNIFCFRMRCQLQCTQRYA